MYPSDNTFVETMCSRNGVIELIDYHNERLNRTRHEVFGCTDIIDIRSFLKPNIEGTYIKVRAVYGSDGITEVTYSPYTPKDVRTLHMVVCDDIDYRYKSTDRSQLSALAATKGQCDEVLIVKNGLITDTSYTNVAVLTSGIWLTPRTPLLRGTRRASLIDKGIITEADITPGDITPDTDIMLFNGMMDFGSHIAHII